MTPSFRPRFGLRRPVTIMAGLALASLLGACASGNQAAPREPLPNPDDSARQWHLTAPAAPAIQRPWWLHHHDNQLTHWIQLGLDAQPSLQQARARLDQARAAFEAHQATRSGQVSANADANRQHISENGFFPYPLAGISDTVYDVDLVGTLDLDLFGVLSSRIEAARLQAQAQAVLNEQLAIHLSGAIAQAYFSLGHAQQTLALLQQQASLRQQHFELTRQRVNAGLDTQVEQRAAEQPLPEIGLELDNAREQVILARHALTALAGQAPDAADTLQASLPGTPATVTETALPLDLLARRADVAAARLQAGAAQHQADAARAAFYPNISISALVGLDALSMHRLLQTSSRTWQVQPAIHLPLLDGGSLRAELRDANARVDEAVAGYQTTVLQAATETANVLASIHTVQSQWQTQTQATQVASATEDLARARLTAGLGTRLSLLAAQGNVLLQQRRQLDLAARGAALDVSLIMALGGGYLSDSPTEHLTAATPVTPVNP